MIPWPGVHCPVCKVAQREDIPDPVRDGDDGKLLQQLRHQRGLRHPRILRPEAGDTALVNPISTPPVL